MQPIKLTIAGEYWDSQIYQGILYLFTRDGAIKTVNWDPLVDGLSTGQSLRLAASCAFQRSDYLYNSNFQMKFFRCGCEKRNSEEICGFA